MSTNPADNFLTGGGVPSAFGKDDPTGTTVTGTVCEPAPTVKQQTDIRDGHPSRGTTATRKCSWSSPSKPTSETRRSPTTTAAALCT